LAYGWFLKSVKFFWAVFLKTQNLEILAAYRFCT